ncbi:MAG: aminotransferase class V-fold PLP-dependent enzyme [Lutimonas sp.]
MEDRDNPIEIGKEEFKRIGYQLVDEISGFLDSIHEKKVTTAKSPKELQTILGVNPLPTEGASAEDLMVKATELLTHYSLHNGHPKFMGFITSSPAPIGMLAELLATAINANVSAQILSPMATEIEKQTIQWLSAFIGVSEDYGGLMVSGGNMANFTAFLTARAVKAPGSIKEDGLLKSEKPLITYCSKSTHTWVEKAAILFGNGSRSIRWIETDEHNQMVTALLEKAITADLNLGKQPFLVVGTAGDVSTGVVDDLGEIAKICKRHQLWFHIDGAYGVPAAVLPELKPLFSGLGEADSIAFDPHKWLYAPLEAGCVLVKDKNHLFETFSLHPEYYNFQKSEEGSVHNFYELGLQNSRGFRALKVWLALQHAGRNGYMKMIRADIALSKLLFDLATEHEELEAISQNLSITALRYIPPGYDSQERHEDYLNLLNEALLTEIQSSGQVFLSNAVVDKKYCLRACIVNFKTAQKDITELAEIVVDLGRKTHLALQEN